MNKQSTGWLLTALFFILATAVNLINPAFEAPDEPDHYEFLRHIVLERHLPVQEIGGPPTESHQPPLYYIIGGFLTAPITDGFAIIDPPHNPNWMSYPFGSVHNDNKASYLPLPTDTFPYEGSARTIHVMRLLSTLFTTGAVFFIWQISQMLFPQKTEAAVLLTAVVAFNPMLIYIAGSVNNDNLIIFIATWHIWLIGRAIQNGYRWQTCVWLGITWGLALTAKLTGLFLCSAWGIGLLAVCTAEDDWRNWRQFRWQFLLNRCLLISSIFLAVAGWWLVRNLLLYGEPFALETTITTWGGRGPGEFSNAQIWAGVKQSWQSFWGRFGSSQIVLHPPVYYFFNGATLVAILGGGWQLWQRPQIDFTDKKIGLWLVLAIVWPIYFAAQLYFMYRYPPGATGRLTYPAIVGFGTLFTLGWLFVPQKIQKPTLYGLSTLLFLISIYSIGLIRWTYMPPRQQQLPTTTAHELVWGDENALLLGTAVNQSVFYDGDEIELTACWDSKRPAAQNYTFFLNVIDQNLNKYAERNTHIGLGNYPTSQWVADEPFCEIYRAPVTTKGVDHPTIASISIGFYARETGEPWQAQAPEGYTLDFISLAPIKIVPDEIKPLPAPQQSADVALAQGLHFAGYTLEPAQDSSQTKISLWWQPAGPLQANYTIFLHVVDEAGELIMQSDQQPATVSGSYPTSYWGGGETVVTEHLVPISLAKLSENNLFMGLYSPDDLSRLAVLDPDISHRDTIELSKDHK